MSKRLIIGVLSHTWMNANANGEGSGGNGLALQHVTAGENDFPTVNGTSIRAAMRLGLQDQGQPTWRCVTRTGYVYGKDRVKEMVKATPKHSDAATMADLMLGYMVKADGMDEATKKEDSLRSCIANSPAVSATPYCNDRGMGLGQKAKDGDPAPFTFERHVSRYYFTVDIGIEDVVSLGAAHFLGAMVDTLKGLRIGGRQTSNLSEMVPEVLFWREYDVRGQGFLGLAHDYHTTPEVWGLDKSGPSLLAPVEALSKDFGFTYAYAGQSVGGCSIQEGLDKIKALLDASVAQIQASKKG